MSIDLEVARRKRRTLRENARNMGLELGERLEVWLEVAPFGPHVRCVQHVQVFDAIGTHASNPAPHRCIAPAGIAKQMMPHERDDSRALLLRKSHARTA